MKQKRVVMRLGNQISYHSTLVVVLVREKECKVVSECVSSWDGIRRRHGYVAAKREREILVPTFFSRPLFLLDLPMMCLSTPPLLLPLSFLSPLSCCICGCCCSRSFFVFFFRFPPPPPVFFCFFFSFKLLVALGFNIVVTGQSISIKHH